MENYEEKYKAALDKVSKSISDLILLQIIKREFTLSKSEKK